MSGPKRAHAELEARAQKSVTALTGPANRTCPDDPAASALRAGELAWVLAAQVRPRRDIGDLTLTFSV